MRADYHFHPNLPLFLPWIGPSLSRARARRIWRAFARWDLSAVIIAEHAYKHPRRSFEILESQRPAGARTEIFPGVEVLTSEGVDLVIFAREKKHLFPKRDFLVPWKLSCEEVIRRIAEDPLLFGMVTHPCTPGRTSIVRIMGRPFTERAMMRLKFLERHNATLASLQTLMEFTGLRRIFPGKYRQMCETHSCPLPLPSGVIGTCGSDAHHPWAIGDCAEFGEPCPAQREALFTFLTTRTGQFRPRSARSLWALPIEGVTVLREWMMKKAHWYSVD